MYCEGGRAGAPRLRVAIVPPSPGTGRVVISRELRGVVVLAPSSVAIAHRDELPSMRVEPATPASPEKNLKNIPSVSQHLRRSARTCARARPPLQLLRNSRRSFGPFCPKSESAARAILRYKTNRSKSKVESDFGSIRNWYFVLEIVPGNEEKRVLIT